DLAVLDEVDRAVLVGDRLVAAVKIDDREPPSGQPDRTIYECAAAVGPAVHQRLVHGMENVRVDPRAAERNKPANSAHDSSLVASVRGARCRRLDVDEFCDERRLRLQRSLAREFEPPDDEALAQFSVGGEPPYCGYQRGAVVRGHQQARVATVEGSTDAAYV